MKCDIKMNPGLVQFSGAILNFGGEGWYGWGPLKSLPLKTWLGQPAFRILSLGCTVPEIHMGISYPPPSIAKYVLQIPLQR